MMERAWCGWFKKPTGSSFHYFDTLVSTCRRSRLTMHPKDGYLFDAPAGQSQCGICRKSLAKRGSNGL